MTDRASFWHLRRFVDKLPGGILCNKTLSLGKIAHTVFVFTRSHYLVGKDRGWVGALENSGR